MEHNESVIESNLHFKCINIQTAANAKANFLLSAPTADICNLAWTFFFYPLLSQSLCYIRKQWIIASYKPL